MRKWGLFAGVLPLLLAHAAVQAADPVARTPAYEIPLPKEMSAPAYLRPDPGRTEALLPGWRAFAAGRGKNWVAGEIRADLGTPAAIYGPGIPLAPAPAGEEAIAEASRRFILENAGLLRVEAAQLGAAEVTSFGGLTGVLFPQTFRGLEVVGGRAELFLRAGQVVLFGAEFFPVASTAGLPALNRTEAEAAAVAGLPFNPVTDTFTAAPRLVVYPIVLNRSPNCYLAYEVRLTTEDPPGDWWIYVDAADGQILSRTNVAADYSIPVSVRLDAQLSTPTDPYTEIASPDSYLSVDGAGVYTDGGGQLAAPVSGTAAAAVHAELRGLFANVNRADGDDAAYDGSGRAGSPLRIKWDDTNSQAAERDAYASVNRMHAWIKALDPAFTGLDYPVVTRVNLRGSCNAYWAGSTLNFYASGGGCVNSATSPDVVLHEYGHAVTQFTYSPYARPAVSGMDEAFSDIQAQTITGHRFMGLGFQGPGTWLRDGMNSRQYPGTECSGEVHCLGEILMGAMWRTRQALIRVYGPAAGVAKYDALWRSAQRTRQISMPNFLTRLLLADDDNADLADGTPDYDEICAAFASHNLPCSPVTSMISFALDPVPDPGRSAGPYEVVCRILPVNAGALAADSLRLFYRTDGGSSWTGAPLTATGNPDEYHGFIPGQPCGAVVDYYLRARTGTGTVNTEPRRAPLHGWRSFMAGGLAASVRDDCEADAGWARDSTGDTATGGLWGRIAPVGMTGPSGEVIEPAADHTPDPGVACWITDGPGGSRQQSGVSGGRTSLLSPLYDFSLGRGGAAAISFWAFWADLTVADDSLTVSASNDGGGVWHDLLWICGPGLNSWQDYEACFTDAEIPFTDRMRFRFSVAQDDNSVCEAAVDDIFVGYTDCRAPSALKGTDAAGAGFRVEPARPNPARGSCRIGFSLSVSAQVRAQVFDASGRRVRLLADRLYSAGTYVLTWDGRDEAGRPVAAGLYYDRIQAGTEWRADRLILVRP